MEDNKDEEREDDQNRGLKSTPIKIALLIVVILTILALGYWEGTIGLNKGLMAKENARIELYVNENCSWCEKQIETIDKQNVSDNFKIMRTKDNPKKDTMHNISHVPTFRNPGTGQKIEGYLNKTQTTRLIKKWR